MKSLEFFYRDTARVSDQEMSIELEKLQSETEKIKAELDHGYETHYAFMHVIRDAKMLSGIKNLIAEKQTLKPTMLIIIGIGGSNLGTQAILQALRGMFYNEHEPNVSCYFLDTIDSDSVYDVVLLAEQALEKGNQILVNVISKSGTTTETIANFELFFYLLKKARPHDYQKYIVVTTDENSKLWKFACDENISLLGVPEKVGGRFSVFSAVGLFPLGFLGIDIDSLLQGALKALEIIHEKSEKNYAALSAAILYIQYMHEFSIHDTFLFSVDLEGLGKWYRQLLAESIGKEEDKDGKKVFVGLTPTVSIGSTDLHSMAQLYLGGPYDKITTFIKVIKNKSNVTLPVLSEFDKLVPGMQGKTMNSIMDAILEGIQKAYSNTNRPYVTIEVPEKSAFYIGQLMQMKMLEVVYLGCLLHINPFNQPNVELYKTETRKILTHE